MAHLLIERGANIEKGNKKGETALVRASIKGNLNRNSKC